VTVCEGFVYMSEFLHSQLSFSQYIAPLMADFTTDDSNDSFVRFFDNGIHLTMHFTNSVHCPVRPSCGPRQTSADVVRIWCEEKTV